MLELTLYETRVLGALVEKSLTTPDQYPLSLNALTNACNQKSNRDPVMALTEIQVQELIDSMSDKGLIFEVLLGSRVPKFKQRFCNTEFSELHLNPQEISIICVLFLRGPQTPGELRSRTNRLYSFSSLTEVEEVLDDLASRSDGPFVLRLAPEPGRRESRYAHLFSGPVDTLSSQTDNGFSHEKKNQTDDHEERILILEEELAQLREDINVLKQAFDL